MKPKLLLLLITALLTAGCDDFSTLPTYYTYVNATDKPVTLTVYDGMYEIGDSKPKPNPTLRFTIESQGEHTISSPASIHGEYRANRPFREMGIKAVSLTLSDGERMVIQRADELYSLFSTYYYERSDTKDAARLKYVITEKDFENAVPAE